jgi:LppP/LprE lipoprotein
MPRVANTIEAMNFLQRTALPVRETPPLSLLGAIFAAALLLAGCGGGTKTETVADTPLPAETTTSATPKTKTSTTTSTPATTPTSTTTTPSEHGGTSAPTTTRTAPAPAFTHEGTATSTTAEGLSAAEAVLRAKGYTATATSEYHSDQTLRVLVGTGSAEAGGQHAFFFVGGRYIGTDAKQPSASIHVVSQSDTEVALAYSLSGGGQATVRFQLNDGKLVPLDPIPSASSRQ